MSDATAADYAWIATEFPALVGAFCITFVRSPDAGEVLRRMGAEPENVQATTFAEAGDRFDVHEGPVVLAVGLGGWVATVEENGTEGARAEVLRALTEGTEAVSVLATITGNGRFTHMADGRLQTAFGPMSPERRWGEHPDRLVPAMRAAGLDPDGGEFPDDPDAAALALADRVTGTHLPPGALRGPLVAAAVSPLLPDPPPRPPAQALRLSDPELAAAVAAAAPALRHAVAVDEARRAAAASGIAGEPLVADALATLERGDHGDVSDGSPLGRVIRAWGNAARVASLAVSGAGPVPMSEDEARAAFTRYRAALDLRLLLAADPEVADYEIIGHCAAPSPRREPVLARLRAGGS